MPPPDTNSTIGTFRDQLKVGVRFNYLGCYPDGRQLPDHLMSSRADRWEVEEVVERGIVISHPGNKGHRHLLEWIVPVTKIKFA